MKTLGFYFYVLAFFFVVCAACKEGSDFTCENEVIAEDDEFLSDVNDFFDGDYELQPDKDELEKENNEDNNKPETTSTTTKQTTVQTKPTTTHSPAKSKKLLYIQLVWRHGDRSPVVSYKSNPNPPGTWEEGIGKLTKLGRKQHYALGKYLHDMYKDFLTFHPNEIDLVSTAYDRTMRSGLANIAGFFAPSKEWKIDDALNWQPIPVRYLPQEEDRWLLPTPSCPRAEEAYRKVLSSPEGQKFTAEHTNTFQKLSWFSGEKNLDLQSGCGLFDTIQADKKYNHIVPEWFDPYWAEMLNLTDQVFYWFYKTPAQRRLRAGPLTGRIIENMNRKLAGDFPLVKVQVYSSHDMTVGAALVGFNVFNGKHPPYCATAVFELHEMTDGSNALRILYLNSTEPENKIDDPHVFTIDGCSEYCPLDYVVKYVNDTIPVNWEKECIINY